ncbi:59ef68b1-b26b-4322-848e-322903f4b64e [Sclerotinia trifoliorum]|uniref:59ef68b1-b26b-4322-848e-322903f4b64e n=1 Tax=Sclerotinia trifoliorum TaxID=28548 RepID=A0A8H2VSY9_9HELO|nr:59ef68b1-b26b-4322-848e-322903f4b64e [Sclerotinia trifoliorum]
MMQKPHINKMSSIISYTTLECWNCQKVHGRTQESCPSCNGWTINTHENHEGKMKLLDWYVFQITRTDSQQEKAKTLQKIEDALRGDLRTAVLAAGPPNGTTRAVYLHRPGGDARLSFTKPGWGRISASSRGNGEIGFEDWLKFEELIGLVKTTNSLPESFPKPARLK